MLGNHLLNHSGQLDPDSRYYYYYQLFGFKSELSYFPDFEVHSRLPLAILSRIVLDAYAASLKNKKQTDSLR